MTFTTAAPQGDVATRHADNCCEAHGCHWGDHACPVTNHITQQAFPCDECDRLADSLADRWW